MTDPTLQRVWDSREAISRRCDFDPVKLVEFYRTRQKQIRTNVSATRKDRPPRRDQDERAVGQPG